MRKIKVANGLKYSPNGSYSTFSIFIATIITFSMQLGAKIVTTITQTKKDVKALVRGSHALKDLSVCFDALYK